MICRRSIDWEEVVLCHIGECKWVCMVTHMNENFAEYFFSVRLMDDGTAAAVLASALFPQDADLTRKKFRRRMRYCRALIEERFKTK